MRLIIQPGYDEVSDWVAKYVARRITEFGPTAEKPFVLGEWKASECAVGPPSAFVSITSNTRSRLRGSGSKLTTLPP